MGIPLHGKKQKVESRKQKTKKRFLSLGISGLRFELSTFFLFSAFCFLISAFVFRSQVSSLSLPLPVGYGRLR